MALTRELGDGAVETYEIHQGFRGRHTATMDMKGRIRVPLSLLLYDGSPVQPGTTLTQIIACDPASQRQFLCVFPTDVLRPEPLVTLPQIATQVHPQGKELDTHYRFTVQSTYQTVTGGKGKKLLIGMGPYFVVHQSPKASEKTFSLWTSTLWSLLKNPAQFGISPTSPGPLRNHGKVDVERLIAEVRDQLCIHRLVLLSLDLEVGGITITGLLTLSPAEATSDTPEEDQPSS